MSEHYGEFICYSWDPLEIVHKNLTSDDIHEGRHRACGKRIAIWHDAYEQLDLPNRRKIAKLGVTRWYTVHQSPDGRVLRLGVLPQYPNPVAFLKEVISEEFVKDSYE
jgi:hypothetical protein